MVTESVCTKTGLLLLFPEFRQPASRMPKIKNQPIFPGRIEDNFICLFFFKTTKTLHPLLKIKKRVIARHETISRH